ncbi:hypothetical protein L873DRAFT_1931623 [Choiromyces venosus 120613-1]|uniref:Uncharacterized protein n=1 Tax=Choiromyces venosus 120613-1 TaxID=1336337 RepID=A0A3N4JAX0_9PEZI|nr:hypothetical protein L873DRAFT_1931623 [Choiromyces venosus 120613-1]
MNIQTDLHLHIPVPHYSGSTLSQCSASIANIPHIHLGHLGGADDFKVFILFPHLMDRQWKTNYLFDAELEHFIDNIFIPAIHQHCPPNVIQHLPAYLEMAKHFCLAASVESLT